MSVSIDKTKTPLQNLFALVNAGNGTTLGEGGPITLGGMVAHAGPSGHNTKITATGVPEQNVQGSKDLYYTRLPMKGSSMGPAKNIHVTRSSTAVQIRDAIIEGWGLIATEVEDIPLPAAFAPSVDISAKAESWVYVGTDTMPLIWDDVPVGPAYGLIVEANFDDNFHDLPEFPFDFMLYGKNLKEETAMGVSSNSFLSMTPDTTYQQATQADPAHWTKPVILIGARDRSLQRLYAGLTAQYTYKIRYEGHVNSSGGSVNNPTIVWELEFFMDGTFTLYTLAPVPAQASSFYTGSNWQFYDGTGSAAHVYLGSGAQDKNFIIPAVDDTTLRFTPGDVNGTTFSCVPRLNLSSIGTDVWFLSDTSFTLQMIVDKFVADYDVNLSVNDLEPVTIPDMSGGGVFEVTLTAKSTAVNWKGSITVSLLLGDGQAVHDHLHTTMAGYFA